jgi:hypothetical protein
MNHKIKVGNQKENKVENVATIDKKEWELNLEPNEPCPL